MTTKFIQLFENSGLTKSEFCKAITMYGTIFERYIRRDIEMSSSEFKIYKERLDNYLKTQKP